MKTKVHYYRCNSRGEAVELRERLKTSGVQCSMPFDAYDGWCVSITYA